MDTNSNIPAEKKVVSVEILHAGDLGYGPYGRLSRSDWQKECMNNFKAGPIVFSKWQRSLIELEAADDKSDKSVRFGYRLIYDNNTTQNFNDRLSHRCMLDFVAQKFDKHIDISSYIFTSETNFAGAAFTGLVSFKKSIFEKAVNFYHTNFAGFIDFSEVTFVDSANFSKSFFTRSTFIGESKLRVLLEVPHAPFSGSINFINAVFDGQVDFSSTIFKVSVNFYNAKFKNRSIFSNSIFEEYSNFENSYFYAVGHFEKAMFIRNIPNFLGVDNAKTLLVFSGDTCFNKNDISEDAIKHIGQLKRLADEQGQTDQALMFNALELNAKAKQPYASKLFKLFTWLYDKISNFGRSFGRPILTYFGLVTITYLLALAHSAIYSPQNCKSELWRVLSDWKNNDYPSCISYELPDDKFKLNGYRASVEYTLYRAAGILDFSDNGKATDAVARRLFGQPIEPWWMRAWGVFKAIASTALLFLAALGLRNKYRIK